MRRVLISAALVFLMTAAVVAVGEELFERPANPPFSVAAVQVHRNAPEGLPRNGWSWFTLRGKTRLVFVDLRGQVVEHAMFSRFEDYLVTPRVEGGNLFVEAYGRTYRFAPNGRVENRSVLGIVPKTIDGPLGTAKLYLPAIVNSPRYVETTQWVEVLRLAQPVVPQAQPAVPPSAPPMAPPAEPAPEISPPRQSPTTVPPKEQPPEKSNERPDIQAPKPKVARRSAVA